MTILDQLGELTASGEPNPAERERVRLHMMDGLAAFIAAARAQEGARILRLGAQPARLSALAEGTLDTITRRVAVARSSEIDDIHMQAGVTAGALIAPTALTLARTFASDPETLAAAIWCGYEIAARLGTAIAGARLLYRGVWPTYLLAPVVTASVTARLLRLSPQGCANALALALTASSGGVGSPPDSATRFLAAGTAARAGASAALAAQDGFLADRTLLDDDWLLRVHGVALDAAAIAQSEPPGAMAELSFKPWCAAKQTIAAIDGFLDILQRNRGAHTITKVRAATPPLYVKMVGHSQCATRIGRIVSLPYQLALAALRPEALIDVTRRDFSREPDIAAFMARVSVAGEEDLMRHFPRNWPARVEVHFDDGSIDQQLVTQAPGDPQRPFDRAQCEAKFQSLVAPNLGSEASSALLDAGRSAFDSRDSLNLLLAGVEDAASALCEASEQAISASTRDVES